MGILTVMSTPMGMHIRMTTRTGTPMITPTTMSMIMPISFIPKLCPMCAVTTYTSGRARRMHTCRA